MKKNKISRFTAILIIGVFFSLLSTPLARAGIPVGDSFVIFDDPEAEEYPALAYNPDRREYLVVWHNDRPAYDDIRALRISEDGTPIGDAFYISGGAPDERNCPDVAYNSQEHQYIVIWEHIDTTGFWTQFSIRARRVSESGQVLDSMDIIVANISSLNGMLEHPKVAYASTVNQYLIVWSQSENTIPQPKQDIAGRLVSAAGIPDPGDILISGDPGNGTYRSAPDVAYNRNRNEFLVVWQQWDNNTGDHKIYARRVRGDGVPMQPESIAISAPNGDHLDPAVASIPTEDHQGQYMVVWVDNALSSRADIWAQRVSGEGFTDGPKFPISVTDADQRNPSVAGKQSSRNYLIAWSHREPGMLNTFIHGREVAMDGSFLGDELPIGGFTTGHLVVASGSVGFLVAFDDIFPMNDNSGIYGQRWINRAIYLPLVRR